MGHMAVTSELMLRMITFKKQIYWKISETSTPIHKRADKFLHIAYTFQEIIILVILLALFSFI